MTIPSEDHGHDNAYSPSPSSPASSSSSLSDAPLAPNKRRRISTSSLSDAEENMPLAARNSDYGHVRNHDQWTSGQKTVPQPGPHGLPSEYSRTEPMHNSSGTIKEVRLKIKVEDMKTDTAQLAQLAQGVAVDPVFTPVEPSARREKPAVIEERNGIIRFVVVKNDGSPTSNILLTGLKVLFQKQLPKMPREYITRLVFDRSSQGMAIVHRGLKVVGGITFRPFPHRSFSEIVFLAISSSFQVNGYGGHLMNKYKAYIRSEMPTILHFLTYADNYAIGYFRKQGFTKDITIPRPLWVGYIKDYEGGTLMQCSMLPKVDYLAVPEILARQKEAIVAKIRSRSSRSDIVYRGLNQFKTAPPGFQMDSRDVPGLKESGWTPEMDDASSRPSRGPQHNVMQRLLAELQAHPSGWAFHEPVSREDVPDYFDVIRKPMDFSTMERKLENNMYATLDDFVEDAKLVFSNCRAYNGDNTYARNASRVEKAMQDWLKDWGAQS
ncbi:hypothetical protein BOTBODRAFT_215473 [Botryobasidium botryosum FD-172 SS1]|uniref:histone acetyltransferase n=1 Tax=Botryobasidium botryosum (strain FD-172 SS1) TaxID=930990 RepID=A0A067N1K4_BOTB1|nr:hypothetical protein BOTBODRAFT_215473 [Botryobasidium botryosum FD-172 SS1]